MTNDEQNIREFSSTYLQRNYRSVFSRMETDGVICIKSGNKKFFMVTEKFMLKLLKRTGYEIQSGDMEGDASVS